MRGAWLVWFAACGGGHGGTSPDAASPDAGPPPMACVPPPSGALVDTSGSTNVVGNGTAASCTTEALQAAVNMGGLVRFDCGAAPVTITLTAPITINNVAGAMQLGDTVIDGGGTVTLSGNHASRIIVLDACTPPYNSPNCDSFPHPALTVERLAFVDASDDSADGGGAIYRRGGALTVIDSMFANNRCATTGQDTAGGALRLIYATPALIVGSTFSNNRCSNGGAIGALGAKSVDIYNSVIDGNTATGNGGNPGNGGNGAGLYYDGAGNTLNLCGVNVTNNHGAAYGGGVFFVDDAGQGLVVLSAVEIANDDIPIVSGMPSHGGAGYIQGADVKFADGVIANSSAGFASGLYINSMNGRGSLTATNVTVTGMTGDGLTLDGGVGGTLLNVTIANNGKTGISGAAALTVGNTIFAGNQTDCDAMVGTMGGNVEAGTGCGFLQADPALAPLAHNGGTTGIRTMAPSPTGAAAGAGSAPCPNEDARGIARPPTGCTSGAHQL